MCYGGKCFRCIPVEHGCLVFGIISAVVTGIATLACYIFGILMASGAIIAFSYARQSDFPFESGAQIREAAAATGVVACIIAFVVGLAPLIAFIFSVLLCNGICKRRPGQVKAYFIYGVTVTVLSVLAAVGELAAQGPIEIGLSALLGCALYCLFLTMVHHTYCKMLLGTIFKDHVLLVEADMSAH